MSSLNSCTIQTSQFNGLCAAARAKIWAKFNVGIKGHESPGTRPSVNVIRRQREEESEANINSENLQVQITVTMNGISSSANYENTPGDITPIVFLSGLAYNKI